MRRRREPLFPMDPDLVSELARYNARRTDGILHEPAYVERMARLQDEFNAARDQWHRAQGHIILTDRVIGGTP